LADPRRIQSYAEDYKGRRQQGAALAAELGFSFTEPHGAFYLWLDLSKRVKDTVPFCRRLLSRHDVLAIPGEAFGSAGAGHVRVSCAVEEPTLKSGMERLVCFLDEGEG
jgi:aminotransferase